MLHLEPPFDRGQRETATVTQSGIDGIRDAILELAKAANHIGDSIGYAARALGLNDAMTEMGALEVVSVEIKNGFQELARAITEASQSL